MNTISYYEAVATASGEMLAAAREQAWDELASAERRCAAFIEQLKAADANASLNAAERQRKAEIIRRVLADDAEIRRLMDPRMRELEHLLTMTVSQRRLDRAYRA